MQVLVPISSKSPFFPREEFFFSKPLIEVGGRPMIDIVVERLRRDVPAARFIFVVDKEDVTQFSIHKILRLIAGDDVAIIERTGPTKGALCSCLLAIDMLDMTQPLIVANSDQVIAEDTSQILSNFMSSDADAGVITFSSTHPRWSYVVLNDAGDIVQVVEKRVVSKSAIAGFYYFAKAASFVEAAQSALLSDAQVDGNYFISASLNELLLNGGRIGHCQIDARNYHSFYSPDRIKLFERSALARRIRENDPAGSRINVVIPAAGRGSRFSELGWKVPKPFLDVNGSMMLKHVLVNVGPKNSNQIVLLQQEHMDDRPEAVMELKDMGADIVPVAQETEGAACTILLARGHFDGDNPLLIANSDQLVDFDVNHFVDECLRRDLDGSIVVFHDAEKNPKWSFAKVNDNGMVTEVAEKAPISNLATVGIYYFKRGSDFVRAAVDMIATNDRVNGEYYTCPVYNYMIRANAQIGVYEVPAEAMHGLGTPEGLCSYLSSIGASPSKDMPDD